MSRDLTTLRRVWLAALAGLVVLSIAPFVAGLAAGDVLGGPSGDPALPVGLPAGLLGALGVAAVVGVHATDRLFAAAPPSSDEDAVRRLQVRSVLQYALAEFPVLLGVILTIVLGPAWVIVAASVPALGALAVAAPRPARLARLDRAWHELGRDVSLLRALGLPDADDASGRGPRPG